MQCLSTADSRDDGPRCDDPTLRDHLGEHAVTRCHDPDRVNDTHEFSQRFASVDFIAGTCEPIEHPLATSRQSIPCLADAVDRANENLDLRPFYREKSRRSGRRISMVSLGFVIHGHRSRFRMAE